MESRHNFPRVSGNLQFIVIVQSSKLADCVRQPGDLGVLRDVAEGVAEEARTRGFASPALARFAFIKR
jgi:hypothetical protein